MIHVKFFGHIKTSMGSDGSEVCPDGMTIGGLFELLRSRSVAEHGHGFTKYNTLVVVNEEEAFSASAQEDRRLDDGDSVLLVPFSHGG